MYNIKTAEDLTREINKQASDLILKQLNDFISRGLIEIKIGDSFLVRDEYNDKIELKQSVELILKDKEYILKLEEKIKKLEEIEEILRKK